MLAFRPWRALAATVLVGFLATPVVAAQRKDDRKDQSKDQSKMSDAQRAELAPLVRTVDELMKGGAAGTFAVTMSRESLVKIQPDPAAISLGWRNDYLKATNKLIYVPFIVTVEAPKAEGGKGLGTSVSGYLRVAPKGTGPVNMATYAAIREGMTLEQVTAMLGKGTENASGGQTNILTWSNPSGGNMSLTFSNNAVTVKAQAGLPELPFEDVYSTDLKSPGAGQPMRLSRAFAVPAGDYDVYVAIRERQLSGGKPSAETTVKVAVIKQQLTVPDFWGAEFTTSSLILADKVEPLSAPLTPEAQKERPYVLGATEIVPATDNKFKKTEELGVIFQVYGYQLGGDKKPDVQIDYMFHIKDTSGTEKPFNKTEPQKFNAQTLPPTFSPDEGHQIVGGQMIPLASFPEGDYRLEIKVTDVKASKTVTREVLFSVVPAS